VDQQQQQPFCRAGLRANVAKRRPCQPGLGQCRAGCTSGAGVLQQRRPLVAAPPPQASPVQGQDLTHSCKQDREQIVAGVAAILRQRSVAARALGSRADLEPPCKDALAAAGTDAAAAMLFRSKAAPKISIGAYLARLRQHLPCSGSCFVLALVYLDRVARADERVAVCEYTCHRLILTGIMLASRFYDEEEDTHFHNAWFAKLGGVSVQGLAGLEGEFLRRIDWRLHVSTEEYTVYHEWVCSAALDFAEEQDEPCH